MPLYYYNDPELGKPIYRVLKLVFVTSELGKTVYRVLTSQVRSARGLSLLWHENVTRLILSVLEIRNSTPPRAIQQELRGEKDNIDRHMTSSLALMERRWGFLAPWCEALDGKVSHVRLEEETVWNTQVLSIEVKIPTRASTENDEAQFKAKFQKAREALALLAAVAHVDYDAWEYLLTSYCGLRLGEEGKAEADVYLSPTYQLVLDLRAHEGLGATDAATYDLVQFCGVHQRIHPTRVYLDALSKISSLVKQLKPGKPTVELQIPVRVQFAMDDDAMSILERLQNLKNIGRAEQMIRDEWSLYTKSSERQQTAPESLRCTFILELLDADFGVDGLSADTIETIDGFALDKLYCSQLHLHLAPELDADEWKAKKTFGQLMTRLFGSFHEVTDPCRPRQLKTSRQDSLRLVCDASLSESNVEAMCTSIVRTQTLYELRLRLDLDTESGRLWKWLAYALFSNRARTSSTLNSIILSGIESMTLEDMGAFALVLGSEYPEEDLHGLPRGLVDGKDAVLKEHAPIRWKFDDQGHPCSQAKLLQLATPVLVRTYSEDGESTWLNALVPGHGRCQVQRDDLNFGRGAAVESTPTGVTSLTIGFGDCEDPDLSGLPFFLLTIGSSLKELTLDLSVVDINENHILQCCPNLDLLSLCVGKVDAELNFRYYRENSEPLPTLNCQWVDIAALARDMADSDNPLSKCVSQLRIRLLNHWDVDNLPEGFQPIDYEDDLTALLLMLETNQTLEYLDIIILERNFGYRSKFQKHHLEPLNRVLGPFSMEGKVAFLSTLASEKHTTEMERKKKDRKPRPVCAASLDQHVVSRIFGLAAPPVTRKVFFRLQTGSWGWRNDWVQS